MAISIETQALIAKEITISAVDKLTQPNRASREEINAAFCKEVSKLYEEVFNTVKRLTEE